jgi:hypothetical protein
MLLLLCGLLTVISGYWYITDSTRVREMAEAYLSKVLGGPVEVGGATLSVFEGLRLDDVKVHVDASKTPDSVIFSARTFLIRYDPRLMIKGKLEATQIIAIDPHVHLIENFDTGRRNYQRMVDNKGPSSAPTPEEAPIKLPEILLRNAQIDYSEVRNGKMNATGSMAIEGRLTPGDEANQYTFALQGRDASQEMGPVLMGSINLEHVSLSGRLRNFELGPMSAMLPREVREWWKQHELAGRVDIPEFSFSPGTKGQKATFKVETTLNGVNLAVHPSEWMSRAENQALRDIHGAFDMQRNMGMNLNGDVDQMSVNFEPTAIKLEQVSGRFIFTQDGIDIDDVTGRLETNGLKINGHIEGYSPEAAATLRVTSLQTENIYIPAAPRYVRSMPRNMRELYEHLHPEGSCSLWLELKRPRSGDRPDISGEITIVDGSFKFDLFPYPMHSAQGKITFGRDEQTGQDRCDIRDLRGLGLANGPNRNGVIHINGWVMPLDNRAEVGIRVEGPQVFSEKALVSAFPPEVQEAVRMFDPTGTGEFPKFKGSFICDVHKPLGKGSKFQTKIEVMLDDASGAFVLLPYPLEHVHGKLLIDEDKVDIVAATVKRGDATLVIDGSVGFGKDKPIVPDLRITARDVPLDRQLIASLPENRRRWLEKIGIGGKIDLDGRVFRDPALLKRAPVAAASVKPEEGKLLHAAPDLTYEFNIGLKEGVAWPSGDSFAVTNLSGELKLTPETLVLSKVKAKRGDAEISAEGSVSGLEEIPEAILSAWVKNLALDQSLYQLLPPSAREAWDAVQPEGTIDAELSYSGLVQPKRQPVPALAVTIASADDAFSATPATPALPTTLPATAPAGNAFELVLHPRKLSVKPKAIPYRLDDLSGAITVQTDKVLLNDLSGKHGEAKITISGTGMLGGKSAWDVRLLGENVTIDDEFRKAAPAAVRSLLDSLKLAGKSTFDFSKLVYRESDAPATRPATSPGDTSTADIDWAAKISIDHGSSEAGVPITDIAGSLSLSGAVRGGKTASLSGKLDLSQLNLAGREVKNFRADLLKPIDQDVFQLGKVQAELAGGELAGQLDLSMPDTGPSQYAINVVLRNADVKDLAQDSDKEIKGQLSASLSVEGNWADPASRRGRGDVTCSGKQMYKIPVVLGLLQITNLALPISKPFNEATCRYSVEGSRVTFEQIELRSDLMTMEGSGHLDFDTRKVKMSFVTDNPRGLKVPFLDELLRGMKNELLQIHVNGTVQEPKVGAAVMNTFTTTVDEVMKGSDTPTKKKGGK